MERELLELRKQIANANAAANAQQYISQQQSPSNHGSQPITMAFNAAPRVAHANSTTIPTDDFLRPHEAVASLLDLRSGLDSSAFLRSPGRHMIMHKTIGDASISPDKITELFNRFVDTRFNVG